MAQWKLKGHSFIRAGGTVPVSQSTSINTMFVVETNKRVSLGAHYFEYGCGIAVSGEGQENERVGYDSVYGTSGLGFLLSSDKPTVYAGFGAQPRIVTTLSGMAVAVESSWDLGLYVQVGTAFTTASGFMWTLDTKMLTPTAPFKTARGEVSPIELTFLVGWSW